MSALSGWELAAAVAITLTVSVLHSMVGFAFGLLSAPAFLWLLPPKAVVVLTVVLMLVLNPLIVVPGRRAVRLDELRRLALPVVAGLPIGLGLLLVVDGSLLRVLIGVALVASSGLMLSGWVPGGPRTPLWPVAAGFLGGVLTTSLNVNGPPVALYLAARRLDVAAFRATIAMYLLAAHALAVVAFALSGLLTRDLLDLSAALAPACVAGHWIGARLWGRLDRGAFARLVLILVAVTGVITLVSPRHLP